MVLSFLNVLFFTLCVCVCAELVARDNEKCSFNPYQFNPGAKARFAVILSIRQSSGSEVCGEIAVSALQSIAAMEWAVKKINTARLIPNVPIGFDLYDDCGLERYSGLSVMNAVGDRLPPDAMECNKKNSDIHMGILGTSRSQTTKSVLSVLKGSGIPVISPFASLPELSKFPNFFRTTPADNNQVKLIVELLKDLGWKYAAILYTTDNYGTNGMNAIVKMARSYGICIDIVQSVDPMTNFNLENIKVIFKKLTEHKKTTAANNSLGVIYYGQKFVIDKILPNLSSLSNDYIGFKWIMSAFVGTCYEVFRDTDPLLTNKAITVSTSSIFVKEIKDYFKDKWEKVAIANYNTSSGSNSLQNMMHEYQTSVNSVLQPSWRNDFIMPIVDAIYALSTALQNSVNDKCSGTNGICDGFEEYTNTNFMNYLKKIDLNYDSLTYSAGPIEFVNLGRRVRFDLDGNIVSDISSPLFDVNIYHAETNSFSKVGEYKNDILTLNSTSLVGLTGQSSCAKSCPRCIQQPTIPYNYLDGDYIFIGLFSLHEPHEDKPYGCGEFRSFTTDVIGQEAFFYAVRKLRKLSKIRFGALAFDDCYSSTRGSLILNEFLSGNTLLSKENQDEHIDPNKVIGVIGPYPSGVTVPLTLLFSKLNLVSISYASTSADLDDKESFPFFLRTVPSDVIQVDAMLAIIDEMGWNHVGMIYINNIYGETGKKLFELKAKEKGICVGSTYMLSETEHSNQLNSIAMSLAHVKEEVMIYFGTESRIVDLLRVMKNRVEERTYSFKYDFVFLASEYWGDSSRIESKFGRVARGTITFQNYVSHSVDEGFGQFLKETRPDINPYNKWFREFWRDYFKCDPHGYFDKTIGEPCGKNLTFSDEDVTTLREVVRTQNILTATFAAGYGYTAISSRKCLDNLLLCDPNDVVESIKKMELPSRGNNHIKTRVFDDQGNGQVGYRILNLQMTGTNEYRYKQVGIYEEGNLVLSPHEPFKFYDNEGKEKKVTANCSEHCPCVFPSTSIPGNPVTATASGLDEIRPTVIIAIAVAITTFLVVILQSIIMIIVGYHRVKSAPDNQNNRTQKPSTAEYYNKYMFEMMQKYFAKTFINGNIKVQNPIDHQDYLSAGCLTCNNSTERMDRDLSPSECYLHVVSCSCEGNRQQSQSARTDFEHTTIHSEIQTRNQIINNELTQIKETVIDTSNDPPQLPPRVHRELVDNVPIETGNSSFQKMNNYDNNPMQEDLIFSI